MYIITPWDVYTLGPIGLQVQEMNFMSIINTGQIFGKAEVHTIATFWFNDTVTEVERSHTFLKYHSSYCP